MTDGKAASQINLRNIVLNMLLENNQGRHSHIILKSTLDKCNDLDKQQRAFITKLFQGTIERQIEEDYIINKYSKTPVNKMKPAIRYILRMAVYQLKYMDTVPESAVCNEAVKLTAKRKFTNLKPFVNGVVRNIARNINDIEYPNDEKENLSVVYSVPQWIVDEWTQRFGIDITKDMLKSLYNENAVSVRVNSSKASTSQVIESLRADKVTVEASELYENALVIRGFDSLSRLEEFKNGNITVQDISSMMASLAANPKSGDYIIDVCASPGGKSLHMADLLQGTGKVEARDLTDHKVGLINDNIARIGFKNISAVKWDATVPDDKNIGKADIVMADLPCSGLGIIGNKVDIKYNTSKAQIKELAQLQKDILKVVSQYVKPGGTLVFSTCTVATEENEENVKWIEENLPFKLESLHGILPKKLVEEDNKGYLQILPGQYGMDGFFISRFRRTDS